MESLDGIRAKLNRAKEHLDVLDEKISTYLANEPYRVVGEEHTAEGYINHTLWLEVDAFPPDDVWGPIIGDAVHNLRSALDHLAWQLALESVLAKTPWRIEFPIILDDPASNPEVRGRFSGKLKLLRPDSHALIEAAQPYKTGGSSHPLWLLQSLWNTDKHRVLHVPGFMFGTPAENDAGFGFNGWTYGPFRRDGDNRTKLGGGSVSAAHAVGSPLQQAMDTYEAMTFDVSLGYSVGELPDQEAPYGGLPLRQVLRRLQSYVTTEIVAPLGELIQ